MIEEGYSTSPSYSELCEMPSDELQRVHNFTVSREGYGSITWDVPVDLTSLLRSVWGQAAAAATTTTTTKRITTDTLGSESLLERLVYIGEVEESGVVCVQVYAPSTLLHHDTSTITSTHCGPEGFAATKEGDTGALTKTALLKAPPVAGEGLNRPATVTLFAAAGEDGLEGEGEWEEDGRGLHLNELSTTEVEVGGARGVGGGYEGLLKKAVLSSIPGALWGGYDSRKGELKYHLSKLSG